MATMESIGLEGVEGKEKREGRGKEKNKRKQTGFSMAPDPWACFFPAAVRPYLRFCATFQADTFACSFSGVRPCWPPVEGAAEKPGGGPGTDIGWVGE